MIYRIIRMNTMNKSLKSCITAILSVFFITLMTCHTVFAISSASFSVTVPSQPVAIGDTVEITVSLVPGDETISSYTYTVDYDSSLLEAVSGGTQEEDGRISYSGVGGTNDTMTATFTFTAIASGTASIETSAAEITNEAGEILDITPAYNSINISNEAVKAQNDNSQDTTADTALPASTDSETDTATVTASDSETDTEASAAPAGTLVDIHSSANTYYVLNKPDSVSVPSSYLPVRIKLNDTDVKAYMKGTSDDTVLIYAANTDGHQGWYYFNTKEGTFLDAQDLIETTDSISSFISKNKFIIMLIAIIVLVILVVVIIILAVSLKGLIADYEAQIDRLKKNLDQKDAKAAGDANSNTEKEPIRMVHHDDRDIPTINDKALFPSDDEIVHETYADSDYDNQVSPDEEDVIHTDDYDDTAFDDMGDADKSSGASTDDTSASGSIDSAFDVVDDNKAADDREEQIKASLEEIDKALESAKKFKK